MFRIAVLRFATRDFTNMVVVGGWVGGLLASATMFSENGLVIGSRNNVLCDTVMMFSKSMLFVFVAIVAEKRQRTLSQNHNPQYYLA